MATRAPRKSGRAAAAADPSGPKTTRPPASSRRPPETPVAAPKKAGRKLDAMPDRVDIRDWFYQPNLAPLPSQVVNCDRVPMILDQGQEGACTGFALAAVINYLLVERGGAGLQEVVSASPRMLYEMARRYDEWPGERYEGSSARGAMKGWTRHGVCRDSTWPANLRGAAHLTPQVAEEARGVPGGAFYRVMHRQVRDMHAALAEVGILYITLMVHNGWFEPGPAQLDVEYVRDGTTVHRTLPVIQRAGRADAGHAVALVGYTRDGFIVQNSWGKDWGADGFALLPYEDYLLHATDVWVAQLGVPVAVDLWAQGMADTTAGTARSAEAIPLADIRPFVVDVANNGELSDSGEYWTTEEDLDRLFREIIPERTKDWAKRRVMLFLHGGLNGEADTARRVLAFRDVLLENEIYPLHIMWESGAVETIRDLVADVFKDEDRAGAVADWLRRTRDGLIEAKDRTFELTVAGPGSALWGEMKENARLSSERRDKRGAMQLMAKYVRNALRSARAKASDWEMHVVAHSAGSIYATYAMPLLLDSGVPLQTLHFMAPAMTVELFKERLLPLLQSKKCPVPDTYILSDVGELDDDVGPYGKSLLYLVSNAFEPERATALLGMAKFVAARRQGEPERPWLDPEIVRVLGPTLVVAGEPAHGGLGPSQSDSHGGFDNDPATLNSILRRILGREPARLFKPRDLQF